MAHKKGGFFIVLGKNRGNGTQKTLKFRTKFHKNTQKCKSFATLRYLSSWIGKLIKLLSFSKNKTKSAIDPLFSEILFEPWKLVPTCFLLVCNHQFGYHIKATSIWHVRSSNKRLLLKAVAARLDLNVSVFFQL